MQILGVNLHGPCFAPVIRQSPLRIFFALVALLDLDLYHVDVDSAYLRAKLDPNDHVYVEQPPGYEIKNSAGRRPFVYKLKKALPGIRQAAAAWDKTLNTALFSMNFKSLDSERCLFLFKQDDHLVMVADWADDMGVAITKDSHLTDKFFSDLDKHFPIKRSEMSLFLGMRVTRDRAKRTLTLDQETAILDLGRDHSIESKSISTPMLPNLVLPECEKGAKTSYEKQYRQVIGSLLHISNHTRPDITYAVGYLSRFNEAPVQQHWDAAVRVVQYLLNSPTRGISYSGTAPNPTTLTGYVDATWVGKLGVDPEMKSTSGYCFFFGGGLVSWRSLKQRRPATSATDAEIIAASDGAREAIFLRKVLTELGYDQAEPTVMFEDNKGCEETVRNGSLRDPLKHMLLKEQYVLWASRERLVTLSRVSTHDQVADIFTKPLTPGVHNGLLQRFMTN
jgi:hypothetical protein